jgi:hypothetical protein
VLERGTAPKCEEYEARLENLKGGLEICAKERSSYCDSITRSLFIMAENRSGANDAPDLTEGKTNTWRVTESSPAVNRAALTTAAAKAAGVSEGAVRLNLEPRAKLKAVPAARLSNDSLLKRVEKVANFGEPAAWSNRGFVTKNALAACDLLAGRLHFVGAAESSLSSTDLTPDVVIDTAWKAYEAISRAPAPDSRLSPVGQSFQVGFFLGRELPELAQPADPLLAVGEVFSRFFEQRSFGFKLKEFGSKEIMRTQIFPDQTYRAPVNHEWSL